MLASRYRKIIDKYPEDATPVFRSTEQSFVLAMMNLNYGKTSTPLGDDVGNDVNVENNIERI